MRLCIQWGAQRAKEAAAGQQADRPPPLASKPTTPTLGYMRAGKLMALTHEEEQPMSAQKLELRAPVSAFSMTYAI